MNVGRSSGQILSRQLAEGPHCHVPVAPRHVRRADRPRSRNRFRTRVKHRALTLKHGHNHDNTGTAMTARAFARNIHSIGQPRNAVSKGKISNLLTQNHNMGRHNFAAIRSPGLHDIKRTYLRPLKHDTALQNIASWESFLWDARGKRSTYLACARPCRAIEHNGDTTVILISGKA